MVCGMVFVYLVVECKGRYIVGMAEEVIFFAYICSIMVHTLVTIPTAAAHTDPFGEWKYRSYMGRMGLGVECWQIFNWITIN